MKFLRTKHFYLDCLLMVLLAILFACNYELFIVKNNFAPAGFNGIGTMIEYLFHFDIGYFTILVNAPLCLLAFFLVDPEFAIKTFIFSLVYALSCIIWQLFDEQLSYLQYNSEGIDTIYPVLIAGSVGGFVYGISFRRNASTGGADIVAKYVSKKDPVLNFFWINFAINAAIALVSFFVYAKRGENGAIMFDYKPVCLCMLYCFLSSLVGNAIIRGSKSALKFLIITSHAEEIDREILEKLKHSATRMKATGAYSGMEKDMIVCVVNRRQLTEFRDILSKYDDTFAFVESVNETFGKFNRTR